MTSPAYIETTRETIESIAELNRAGRPNMMFAGVFINAESAKLGYLLSRLVSPDSVGNRHYTFFGNSTIEALGGAIKVARHTWSLQHPQHGGRVLVMGEGAEALRWFFDPTGAGPEKALVPGLEFASSAAAALELLLDGPWAAVLAMRSPGAETDDDIARVFAIATETGAMRIVCNSEIDLAGHPQLAPACGADVFVFGENLTGWQVPFGCFTMSRKAYAVWNNPTDSSAHSSTFGGNAVCLTSALAALEAAGYTAPDDQAVFDEIEASFEARLRYYRDHVNPQVAVGMEAFGFALDIQEARGGQLTLRDGRVITDCSGGTGANLRGHNPPDVVTDVLMRHDAQHDYFGDLESYLLTKTRFSGAFPGVSGGTGVDNAVMIAMLAARPRTKIVTFKGNFSGKTIISLNLSRSSPESVKADQTAFAPYYFDLVELDPFRPDSVESFRSVSTKGDVALVWLETSQGMNCRPLPDALLRAINELKGTGGYLIGVDEVLTGVWRTGEVFLAQEPFIESDITVIGKPLSDMTLPISVTLVTDEVLRRVDSADPSARSRLAQHYRHALCAHVALHALTTVASDESLGAAFARQRVIQQGLDAIVRDSSLFGAVAGRGFHARLVLKDRWFPFHRRSQVGRVMELALCDLILQRCDVLLAQLRLFPGLFDEETDFAGALERVRQGTASLTPLAVYGRVVSRLATLGLSRTRSRLRRGRRRPPDHEDIVSVPAEPEPQGDEFVGDTKPA